MQRLRRVEQAELVGRRDGSISTADYYVSKRIQETLAGMSAQFQGYSEMG